MSTEQKLDAQGSTRYMRRNEAAEMLGVTPRCLTNWMQRGILPHFKIGRVALFDPKAIREHLELKFKGVAR